MSVSPRQTFFIESSVRHDNRVPFNGDEILAAATGMALTCNGITPNTSNMVFAATNSKHTKTGPWMLSMPKECEATITQDSFTAPCIQLGKQPAVMIKLFITVAKPKGENTMPAKPQHNTKFWLYGEVSMEAAANPHLAAGLNQVLRESGVMNPRSKLIKSKDLRVATTRVQVFLDSIAFRDGVGKEQGWKTISMPLPFTIQQGTTKYNFTIKNISPEVCTAYGRRKCCWRPFTPEAACGCKQRPPVRKNQPKFGHKDLLASMQQNARDAAASEEAAATASNDEELESPSPTAVVEVAVGSAAESAVESKAPGQEAPPKGATPIVPPQKKKKRSESPPGPALSAVLKRKPNPKAQPLQDSTVTLK